VAVEMAIWKMTPGGPVPVAVSKLDFEQRLEDMIANDPALVGLPILILGRQVATKFGGFVDLLGVDAEGRVHVLELKRDRTPREVVAQILDYGAWAQTLTLADVGEIFADKIGGAFDEAFAEHFAVAVPDAFNADQQLTVVASELDPASDRIIEFLASRYDVPVNAVFFRHFKDGESEYLARTWLRPPEEVRQKKSTKVRPWNGRDYYVVLGRIDRHNRWPLGRKYGFVSASGGAAYTKPLRNLKPDNRVFAYLGGAGYVGIGKVTGEPRRLRDAISAGEIELDPMDVPEWEPAYRDAADDDMATWIVPIAWEATRDEANAVRETGLFSVPITACKLRDERTVDIVSKALNVSLDD
jgi:Endonuclease NucS